jgi:hypothetical protein
MAIAVVSSVSYTETGTAATTHTLTGVTMGAGNGRLVAIAHRGTAGAIVSVTDTNGNSYRVCGFSTNTTTTVSVETWVTVSASPTALSSASITVTTTTAIGVAFRVYELSGTSSPLTNWLDINAARNGSSTSIITFTPTQASPFATDFAFCAFATDGATTVSASAFTAAAATATNIDSSTTTSSAVQLTTAYLVLTVTTAQQYSATLGTSRAWADLNTRYIAGGLSYTAPRFPVPTTLRRSARVASRGGMVAVHTQGQFIPSPTQGSQPT